MLINSYKLTVTIHLHFTTSKANCLCVMCYNSNEICTPSLIITDYFESFKYSYPFFFNSISITSLDYIIM